MNKKNGCYVVWKGTLCALAATSAFAAFKGEAQAEQTFTVLTIGAHTYTNVTVTTKAKSYVMLMHSDGLANIRVADLSPELRQTLGYQAPADEKPKGKTTQVTRWAKETFGSLKIDRVQALEANFRQKWNEKTASGELPVIKKLTPRVMYCAAGGALVFWIIFSACLQTICKKTGKEPGFLIWLPILQIFPMLTAAEMSMAWILGCPFGLTQIVWCFKIAKARGKSVWVGVLLLLPVTNVFAFLYLAFSNGAAAAEERPVEIMTLEAA